MSTCREPIRGWIDNLYGLVGITACIAIGMIQSFLCDVKFSILPGDLATNALIVNAWDTAISPR